MKPKSKSRRSFLITAGIGGTGAAIVAAAALKEGECAQEVAQAPESKDGYRLTQHIQTYYKTTEI